MVLLFRVEGGIVAITYLNEKGQCLRLNIPLDLIEMDTKKIGEFGEILHPQLATTKG